MFLQGNDNFVIYHAMRKQLASEKKHKAVGVSFPPELRQIACRRADRAGMSFSRYLQHLVEADLRNNILPGAVAERLGNTGMEKQPEGKNGK